MKVTGVAPWSTEWPQPNSDKQPSLQPVAAARIRGRKGCLQTLKGDDGAQHYIFLPEAPFCDVTMCVTNPPQDLMAIVCPSGRLYASTSPLCWVPRQQWDIREFDIFREDLDKAINIKPTARVHMCVQIPLTHPGKEKDLTLVDVRFIPLADTTMAILGYDSECTRFWLFDLGGGKQLAHLEIPRDATDDAVPQSFNYGCEREPEVRPSLERILSFFLVTIFFSNGAIAEITPVWPGGVWCRVPQQVYMAIDYMKARVDGVFGSMTEDALQELDQTLRMTWEAVGMRDKDEESAQARQKDAEAAEMGLGASPPSDVVSSTPPSSDSPTSGLEEPQMASPPLQPPSLPKAEEFLKSPWMITNVADRPSSASPTETPRIHEAPPNLPDGRSAERRDGEYVVPFSGKPSTLKPFGSVDGEDDFVALGPPAPVILQPEVSIDTHGQRSLPARGSTTATYTRGDGDYGVAETVPRPQPKARTVLKIRRRSAACADATAEAVSNSKECAGATESEVGGRDRMIEGESIERREMTLALYSIWRLTCTLEMVPAKHAFRHHAFLGRPSNPYHFPQRARVCPGVQVGNAPALLGHTSVADGLVLAVRHPHELVLLARTSQVGRLCDVLRTSGAIEDDRWKIVGVHQLPDRSKMFNTDEKVPPVVMRRASHEAPVIILGYGKSVYRIIARFLTEKAGRTDVQLATTLEANVRDIECTQDGQYVQVILEDDTSIRVATLTLQSMRPPRSDDPVSKRREKWSTSSLQWLTPLTDSIDDTPKLPISDYLGDFVESCLTLHERTLCPMSSSARFLKREAWTQLAEIKALLDEKLALAVGRASSMLKQRVSTIKRMENIKEDNTQLAERLAVMREQVKYSYNMKLLEDVSHIMSPIHSINISGIHLNCIRHCVLNWLYAEKGEGALFTQWLKVLKDRVKPDGESIVDWSTDYLLNTVHAGQNPVGVGPRSDLDQAFKAKIDVDRVATIHALVQQLEELDASCRQKEATLTSLVSIR